VIPEPGPEDRARLPAIFNAAAEDYQRSRPVSPAELFDDLVELAGLAPGARVLEIGPGTGQATVPLASRGLAVTAVEPGAALAAVARRRLADLPNARVVTSTFEAWEPDGGPFDAVLACNSLHWVDPALRYRRPAELIRDGGHMIVISTQWAAAPDAERFWADVQEDYRAVDFPGDPHPALDAIGPSHLPPDAAAFFAEVAARTYPFRRVYTADEYLANLGTQTGPAQLGPERRAEFLERVRRRLAGWPRLTATFVARLTVGRRHSGM
jgi:protein-L-isoaspartate O-methyltransferase